MKKIIMRRDYQGRDSWGAFMEVIAIDNDGKLYYRRTDGGNCKYGDWQEWEGEERAIKYIFGDIILSRETIRLFREDCLRHRGLNDKEYNLDCY